MSRLWNACCCKLTCVRRLWRESSDLITALALTFAFALIVINFPNWENIIRAGFGAVVMVIIPGYLLTLVLFPSSDGIDVAERTALTLALSAITIIAVGLVLNYLPAGIRAGSMTVGLTVANTVFAVLGGVQRARLEPSRRFFLPPAVGFRRLLTGVAGFVVVIALFNAAIPQDRFTEFYLLGPTGRLDDYPRNLQPGETFELRVGVSNFEGGPQTYRLRLPSDDPAEPTLLDVPQLQHEEAWETQLTLQAPRQEGSQQLMFELLKGDNDNATAHRQLTFTININGADPTPLPARTSSALVIPTAEIPPAVSLPDSERDVPDEMWLTTFNRPSVRLLSRVLEPAEPAPPFRDAPVSDLSTLTETRSIWLEENRVPTAD